MAPAPGRRSRTAVIVEYGVGPVVAVGGDAAAAGAEVVMGIAVVDGVRRVDIPVQVLVEAMLPGNGIHVRLILGTVRIVVMLPARISRRCSGMRPADAEVILRRQVIRRRKPRAHSRSLVLELKFRR